MSSHIPRKRVSGYTRRDSTYVSLATTAGAPARAPHRSDAAVPPLA